MSVRQTNIMLQITAVVLATAAVSSLVLGLMMPLQLQPVSQSIPKPAAAAIPTRTLPPVSSFSPLFARSLQTGLGGAAATAATKSDSSSAESTVPISQLVLVGTVGNNLALIKGPDGSIAMIEAGDDVEGSLVLAIRASQVDLRVDGKVTTLRIAPPPDDRAILQVK